MERGDNTMGKEFKIGIGTNLKNERRDMTIISREYRHKIRKDGRIENQKWYKYVCNRCGWTEGWMIEGQLIGKQNKNGCSCCRGYTKVVGINTILDTDPWMLGLGVSKEDARIYTKTSGKKIEVTCPNCGKKMTKQIGHIYTTKSIGCSCGDGFSYNEKFINSILNQLEINFETEYSPKYLNKKRSDFYIPNLALIIETDGAIGHKGGRVRDKTRQSLEDLIEVDKWKDEQHLLHRIKTIRIDCKKSELEYIKNSILNSELVNYFNFNNIDWVKAENFALSNRVREVCDVKKNNPQMGVGNISKIVNLDRSTIIRYLKRGNKLGLCEYNPKEEKIRSAANNRPDVRTPIEIFKDDISLGIFESISELEKKSKEIFGTILNQGNISNLIRGKYNGKTYKGYTFKYVDKEEYINSTKEPAKESR